MDPEMISVLAGRVALERLATVEHEQHARSRRRFGSLARLARRSVTLVAGLTSVGTARLYVNVPSGRDPIVAAEQDTFVRR